MQEKPFTFLFDLCLCQQVEIPARISGQEQTYSSRRIAKVSRARVDFMSGVSLDARDFRTIVDFRKPHLQALAGLITQGLISAKRDGG